MRVEPDFVHFLELLKKHNVEYLIVGGYAVAFHSRPRQTGDIDIFLNSAKANAEAMLKVLDEFGYGNLGIEVNDFNKKDQIIQLGMSPVRIDLLTGIDGVEFEYCYNRRVLSKIAKIEANFISREDLIKNKAFTGRIKDLADLEELNKYSADQEQ